jgi:hypothetical protein
MIDDAYIIAVEQRAAQSIGKSWSFARGEDDEPVISVVYGDGHTDTMRVTRESSPASEADVSFIASSRADIDNLLSTLRGSVTLSLRELAEIEDRCGRAAPEPWTAFIEADGGLAGSDVIRVTESDDEPDLYLWIGSDLAPSATFRFVAAARQDIPRLVTVVREQLR